MKPASIWISAIRRGRRVLGYRVLSSESGSISFEVLATFRPEPLPLPDRATFRREVRRCKRDAEAFLADLEAREAVTS